MSILNENHMWRRTIVNYLFVFLMIFLGIAWVDGQSGEPMRVLVFSKTAGYRHVDAIPAGQQALFKLGSALNIVMDTTEDATLFNEDNLKRYAAVLFLNASGEILNAEQRNAFQRYIQAGGGFMAIHGPTDAERDWPWYNRLIGAYFESHPSVQQVSYYLVDKDHLATRSLPDRWNGQDEIYNFKKMNPSIKPLVNVDEKTYQGGKHGDNHPVVWYHEFDGGKSFYIAGGHTPETYSEPNFLQLMRGGLLYVTGGGKPQTLNYSWVSTPGIPEANRFTKNILLENLNEPMHLAFSNDGYVYFAERGGAIKVFDPVAQKGKLVGNIPVYSKYEDGLLGITLDPAFKTNRWLYTFYTAHPGKLFHISRFTLNAKGLLDLQSEKVLLTIPKEILSGSHTGGGMMFDPRGNGDLFITVGDNTNPFETGGYGPMDERDGRMEYDALRTSANTNDLRGKILRIHPEPDGTYTIPKGNLFPKDLKGTRPEIYTMGHRQPWRIYMDSKTGWIYESEVGPDSRIDSANRGPRGYDEFNLIKGPGNYGWPMFLAGNEAYAHYDYATGKSDGFYQADKPVNFSRYNNGLKELPAALGALIWYPYAVSAQFPSLGSGGRSATGGPVFHKYDFKNAKNLFPDYYEGKWFISDFVRGWIMTVSFDENSNLDRIERFMPDHKFSNPIDMQFAPDGNLYMLEYGSGWFRGNPDARLVSINYNSGNRKPLAVATANKTAGALPLTVRFSSEGTVDLDKDSLSYHWKIISPSGAILRTFSRPDPVFTFSKPGIYKASLTVTDAHGSKGIKIIEIRAGNEPPKVSVNIIKGNKTFFFPNQKMEYVVTVTDKEDGSLANNTIPASRVEVSIDYLPDGVNNAVIAQPGHKAGTVNRFDAGRQIMANLDCKSCHLSDEKSVGPSFLQVAKRYEETPDNVAKLISKVINGGSGSWGPVSMSAHPQLKKEDAEKIVRYILSLNDITEATKFLSPKGSYTFKAIDADTGSAAATKNPKGVYIIRAVYPDKGSNTIGSLQDESVYILRYPQLAAGNADFSQDVSITKSGNNLHDASATGIANRAYFGFRSVDLTGIGRLELFLLARKETMAGGVIEVRIGSATGILLGKSAPIEAINSDLRTAFGQIIIPIVKTNGIQDLYFVFRNESSERKPLLTVQHVIFRQAQ